MEEWDANLPVLSGNFEVQSLTASDPGYRSALALALSGSPCWDDSIAGQINHLVEVISQQGLRMELLAAAYAQATLVASSVAIVSPGATALVYSPPGDVLSLEREAVSDTLIKLRQLATEKGITLLQSLLVPGDTNRAIVFATAGFRFLAELIYMDRPAQLQPVHLSKDLKLQFINYSESVRPEFIRALEASYVDSLDCPGLNGLRDMDDVLTGHKATGIFDPAGWYLAIYENKPAGVLLTAKVADRSATEIVYIGVAHDMRGQGIAGMLMNKAIERAQVQGVEELTLAVDSINEPARRLYQHWGFTDRGRRRAWIVPCANRRNLL